MYMYVYVCIYNVSLYIHVYIYIYVKIIEGREVDGCNTSSPKLHLYTLTKNLGYIILRS